MPAAETPSTALVHTPDQSQALAISDAATAGAAAMAKAQIVTRYEMAVMRPRDLEQVRLELVELCRNPGFADRARYVLKFGDRPEDWSIRFIEAAIGAMGNIDVQIATVFDDGQRRMIRIAVVDLQRNSSYTGEQLLERTVERHKLRTGQVSLGQRVNSSGDVVHIVAATEQEMTTKANAAASKIVRVQAQRMIPPHILDECLVQVRETLEQVARDEREAEQRAKDLGEAEQRAKDRATQVTRWAQRVADAFLELGVGREQLEAYLGHALEQATNEAANALKVIGAMIRDDEAKWSDFEAMAATDPANYGEGDVWQLLRERMETKWAEIEAAANGGPTPDEQPASDGETKPEVTTNEQADDGRVAPEDEPTYEQLVGADADE